MRRHGPVPDGCLLLINTNWRRAPPPRRTAGKPPPTEVGITLEAVQHLLKRAPKMIGIGLDTPTLDPAPLNGSPKSDSARRLLVSKGKLVLEALDDIDRLPRTGARLLLVRLPGSPPKGANVRVLALFP
jgi:kynurenine formamidase